MFRQLLERWYARSDNLFGEREIMPHLKEAEEALAMDRTMEAAYLLNYMGGLYERRGRGIPGNMLDRLMNLYNGCEQKFLEDATKDLQRGGYQLALCSLTLLQTFYRLAERPMSPGALALEKRAFEVGAEAHRKGAVTESNPQLARVSLDLADSFDGFAKRIPA